MNKGNFFKILTCIFIFVLIFNLFVSQAYAKTSTYANNDQYDDSGTNEVKGFITGIILDGLGRAILVIAWCIEKLATLIVYALTGMKIFPWSDKIIFNSIPLLDVNFINPAQYSLFYGEKSYTTIGKVVRNVYFSGMSIGLGFFGIIVAVMAIKLAISSIAAEKAKYKEAIVHWLTALILLFSMHYILSFVFYLNEQLVEVASNIVNTQINANPGSQTVYDLATYFKIEAVKDWGVDTFIASVLYAAFIVQSLMFFFAYIKRLFYVVILAAISPFVVVYDFLKKAIS